jgi:HK97 family phage portal protein
MGWSWRKALGVEQRDSPESIKSSATAAEMLAFFGLDSSALPTATPENAMKVPAYSSARNFLSSSLANLPLHAYRTENGQAKRLGGALQRLLNEAPNAEWSSYGARKYFWSGVFGERGRGLLWIERGIREPLALWPMDPTKTTVKRVGVRKVYEWNDNGVKKTYDAADVIDVPFLLKADQLSTYSTLSNGTRAIQLALAMNDYGSQVFANGGVLPLAVVGPPGTGPDATKRMIGDISRLIDQAKQEGKQLFPLPSGYDIKPVGFDPEKGQMTEARRFQIEEIARVFNLPPVFLQDLTHGTFSNTEMQDIAFVKHVVSQWAKALEDEINLKLFGAENNRRFVEHSLDGLLRGDFLSRMQAHGQAVQNAIRTPNEVRALENLPPKTGGDDLLIQGATVPVGTQQNTQKTTENQQQNLEKEE